MPDKDEIIFHLKDLKEKPMGFREATDEEIWEADEAGSHFMVTRESFKPLLPLDLVVYALSVSGLYTGKEKVISDFMAVLGIPLEEDVNLADPNLSFLMRPSSRLDTI